MGCLPRRRPLARGLTCLRGCGPARVDPKGGKGVPLGGEVLVRSPDPRVANLEVRHVPRMPLEPPRVLAVVATPC